MPTTPIPRDQASARAAAIRAERDAYEQHLAAVRASQWRLGTRGRFWMLARNGPDTDGWLVLDDQLEAFADIDPAAERKRVVAWVREVLDVRLVWLWLDHTAAAQGRTAYEVDVKS